MISRRSFLKLSAVAAASFGIGYTLATKNYGDTGEKDTISHRVLCGMLPKSNESFESFFSALQSLIPNKHGAGVRLVCESGSDVLSIAQKYFPQTGTTDADLLVRVTQLKKAVQGDILLYDSRNAIYAPEAGLTHTLNRMRSSLIGVSADVMVTAEFWKRNFMGELLATGSLKAVIRHGKTIIDEAPLSRKPVELLVKGNRGNTKLLAGNGSVSVIESSCTHALCQAAGSIRHTGEVIACAPNGILIDIVKA